MSRGGRERYRRALERLAGLARFGVRPGLETIGRLCERLGHPERGVPALHIAGTNGKGSTAAFAESLLRAGGARVGLYTSPHLLRFTERIRLDGNDITAGRCAELVERSFEAASDEGLEPTFFEIATAAAFLAFAEARLDIAVIECGLGGRLDATNVCRAVASVVTPIGLDHAEVLGGTVEAIAFEKAAIARAGVPLIAGRLDPAPWQVVEARARELAIPLLRLGRDFTARHRRDSWEDGDRLDYEGPGGALEGALLGLAGAHQADNAAVALAAVALAWPAAPGRETHDTRRAALAGVRWPGRLERLAGGVRVDGAHNPQGAQALAAALAAEPPVTLLVGVLGDKDAGAVLRPLLPLAARLVCTRPASPRALPAAALADIARRLVGSSSRGGALPIECEDDVPRALARARSPAGEVVACGSLYLVGELRALLLHEEADEAVVADPLPARG